MKRTSTLLPSVGSVASKEEFQRAVENALRHERMAKREDARSPKKIPQLIFDPEDDDLHNLPWRLDSKGYAVFSVHRFAGYKKQFTMIVWAHRIVCLRHFGRKPDWSIFEHTDHINRNKLDNRRSNLRIVTAAENNKNKDNGSRKEDSVTFHRCGKWQGQFRFKHKSYYCGLHATKELAIAAVRAKKHEVGYYNP